jgi:hypothetical protein
MVSSDHVAGTSELLFTPDRRLAFSDDSIEAVKPNERQGIVRACHRKRASLYK